MKCPFCQKNIQYFHQHFNLCKIKYEKNSNRNIKSSIDYLSEFNMMYIKTFKDLQKFTQKQNNIINEPQLFKYFNDYNIGIGRNIQVFYGKDRINNEDLAVKVEIKNKNNQMLIMK